MYDLIIIGGGPAGLSAAITARARNKDVLVVSNPIEQNPLAASRLVDNYPGMPGTSGLELLKTMHRQALDLGAAFLQARVISVLPFPGGGAQDVAGGAHNTGSGAQGAGSGAHNTGSFAVTTSSDYVEGKSVVLACGAASGGKPYLGEQEFLGRGVSYCATCDGMLYRAKTVLVVGLSKEAPEEANFLAELGATVHYVARELPGTLGKEVEFHAGRLVAIEGDEHGVCRVRIAAHSPNKEAAAKVIAANATPENATSANTTTEKAGIEPLEQTIEVQGVFVLRPGIAPTSMLAALETAQGFVAVDARLATNIAGLFAAGDCTGTPLQVAKAVGEGLRAALSAVDYLAGSFADSER